MKKKDLSFVEVYDVDFKSPAEFCRLMLDDSDYFFALSGTGIAPHENKVEDDRTKEFMEEYDQNLFQVYQRKDDSMLVKNIKMMDSKNPNDKGFIHYIEKLSGIGSKLKKSGLATKVAYKLADTYDKYVKDRSGHVPSTYIWVPMWNANADVAKMVILLDRVIFVFS